MKKTVLTITVLLLVLALVSPVMASTLTPSATAKPAPTVKGKTNDNGETVFAEIKKADGSVVQITESIAVTALSETANAPAEVATALNEAYEEISAAEDVPTIATDIMEVAPGVFGSNVKAEDLVVRDLFDLSVPEDAVPKDGSTLTITFENSSNDPLLVIIKCSDKWTTIPSENVVNNGDGTVTVTFSELCPIAFVVKGEASAPVVVTPEPTKKSNTGLIAGIVAAVAAIGGGTAYAVTRKKK